MTRLAATLVVWLVAASFVCATAHAATRVYLMRGLGGLLFSDSMDQTAAKLHLPIVATVGDWSDGPRFTLDARTHPHDRIVLVGHSMGAKAAGDAARELKDHGIRAKVIGVDPLFSGASCEGVADCICFWGQGFTMPGAQNVYIISTYGHIGYAADPRVQSRIIAAIGK